MASAALLKGWDFAKEWGVSNIDGAIGGFIGGITLGLIGWGISYAVVSNGNPKPPYQEIKTYDENCKSDYESGYKEGALKVKKSSVSIGGALGTIMIVNILL